LGYLDNPGPVPLSQLTDGQFRPSKQNIQLENKEEEIKKLKAEVINLTEEMEELKAYDSKRK
jgi:hypothetical protein